MTRYKVQILNIVVLVVCLILGQTAMPAYAYDIDGSRLKLDAEINSSMAVVHIIVSKEAYPEEVQKVKDAERQAAKQRLIDGVENTTIKLATLRQEGSISLKWKKSAGYRVDYYEVFRSKKKSSGYGVMPFYTTDSAAKTTYKNTKWLHKGWRYYYKVRGVRIIDGEKYYTQWSNKSWRTAL